MCTQSQDLRLEHAVSTPVTGCAAWLTLRPQEKNKLITDIKRLKEHFAKYEPIILDLKKKYETAMKEKMMSMLERDKLNTKVCGPSPTPVAHCVAVAHCVHCFLVWLDYFPVWLHCCLVWLG